MDEKSLQDIYSMLNAIGYLISITQGMIFYVLVMIYWRLGKNKAGQ